MEGRFDAAFVVCWIRDLGDNNGASHISADFKDVFLVDLEGTGCGFPRDPHMKSCHGMLLRDMT